MKKLTLLALCAVSVMTATAADARCMVYFNGRYFIDPNHWCSDASYTYCVDLPAIIPVTTSGGQSQVTLNGKTYQIASQSGLPQKCLPNEQPGGKNSCAFPVGSGIRAKQK